MLMGMFCDFILEIWTAQFYPKTRLFKKGSETVMSSDKKKHEAAELAQRSNSECAKTGHKSVTILFFSPHKLSASLSKGDNSNSLVL